MHYNLSKLNIKKLWRKKTKHQHTFISIKFFFHLFRFSFQVMAFIQVVAPSSTSFLIVSMALDRYRAVINASRSSKQIYVMIAGSWGLSLLLSCPQLYGWGTFDQNGEEVCGAKADWLSSSAFQMYMIIIFILILVIPTSANCFCYGKIIKKLVNS